MLYVALLILVLILFACVVFLEEKRIQNLKEQLEQAKTEERDQSHTLAQCSQSREEIWEYANTIHLYASLSEEEAKTESLREKQSEILRMTEALLVYADTFQSADASNRTDA